MAVSRLELKDWEDLQELLDSSAGARFVSRILDYCGILSPSFNTDIAIMSFKEGRRDVGLMIMSAMQDIPKSQEKIISATSYRLSLYKEDTKQEKSK